MEEKSYNTRQTFQSKEKEQKEKTITLSCEQTCVCFSEWCGNRSKSTVFLADRDRKVDDNEAGKDYFVKGDATGDVNEEKDEVSTQRQE